MLKAICHKHLPINIKLEHADEMWKASRTTASGSKPRNLVATIQNSNEPSTSDGPRNYGSGQNTGRGGNFQRNNFRAPQARFNSVKPNFQNTKSNYQQQYHPNQQQSNYQQGNQYQNRPVNPSGNRQNPDGPNGDLSGKPLPQDRKHTAEGVCWYHDTFGTGAYRCITPCTFHNKPQGNW